MTYKTRHMFLSTSTSTSTSHRSNNDQAGQKLTLAQYENFPFKVQQSTPDIKNWKEAKNTQQIISNVGPIHI